MNRWKGLVEPLLHPVIAVIIGLVAGAIGILIVGESVSHTYMQLVRGAFGNFYFTMNTFARATPIMLVGVGVALAFRAGVFNLGAEGQLVLGGVSAALTALYLPGPGWFRLIAALIVAMSAGGLWSYLGGWMEAKFRVNLLISTLLLNYIATLWASYLVSSPFKDTSGSAALAQTRMIDKSAWLPKLFQGMSVHAGFLLAVLAVLIVYLLFRYTTFGYEVKMLGHNPFFSVYGGVNRSQVMLLSMFVSGGLAGLAGASEVLGMQYRFIDNALTVPQYAWTGIMAALLANSHPIGTGFAALMLAALQTGAMGVERNTQVPLEISGIIQAVLILFVSAKFSYSFLMRRKPKKTGVNPKQEGEA